MTPFLLALLLPWPIRAALWTPSQFECVRRLDSYLEPLPDEADAKSAASPRESPFSPTFRVLDENRYVQFMDLDDDQILSPAAVADVGLLGIIWKAVLEHPIAGLCHLAKYDPTGKIGFCFGRSMAVHLEAVLRGIDERDIRKVFIQGHFKNPVEGEDVWVYHVATVIRTASGWWYAIDPRLRGPVPVTRWGNHWTNFATGNFRFSIGEADVLWPTGGTYAPYFKSSKRQNALGKSDGTVQFKYLRALAQNYRDQLRRLADQ